MCLLICANVSLQKARTVGHLLHLCRNTSSRTMPGKKGPAPAYSNNPATPSSPPYPVQQGPSAPPMGAPPAYAPAPPPGHQSYPQQPYYAGGAVPQAPVYPQNQYGPPIYGQQAYPVAPAMTQPLCPPPGQPVVVPGLFDAGARFDGGAPANIPPPPPGCPPNAAQMAAMQGHTVVGTQQRSNFWTDGSGGGMSFW
ncbi:uncharacterized protein LOC143290582 [Babylonia areolata]|uniref:uncharacterized protein LOC143290582 n=1 Tax=Babylonia areolata TaxID=304850 RepID=UPI003FD0800C